MDKTSTTNGSADYSQEATSELIKVAGLLNTEEWDTVRCYLQGLQSDVNDDVVKRIVRFSKNYNEKKFTGENIIC